MAIQWNLSKTDHQIIDVLFIVLTKYGGGLGHAPSGKFF